MGNKKGKRAAETKKDRKRNRKEEEKRRKKNEKLNNKKEKKQKEKKERIWPKILIIILLLLAIVGGVVFAYRIYENGGGMQGILAAAMGHDKDTKKNLPEFRCLLMGISTDLSSKLTDTIIVASYNPNTQEARMLSIPRDTFVGKNEKKATGSDKINALYSVKKGPEGTLEAVNDITGLDIKYYAVVETEALIKLVDAIGPVTFNVPINMKYDDPTQNLHINLQAGEQEIDGDKAEQLLRFRHNNDGSSYPSEYGDNDIGRMRTQREFISETMRQTLKVSNIFKLGQILDIAKESIETNIDFNAAKDYIPYLVEFSTDNLTSDNLPGTPAMINELWFYKVNKTEAQKLIDRLFNNVVETSSPSGNTTNTAGATKTKEQIKISVIDATGGNTEKFESAIQKLEAAGFSVTKQAETKSKSTSKKKQQTTTTKTTSRTVITNQKYVDGSIVEEVKNTLGVGDISNNSSSSSEADLSITIGTDFN